MKVNKISEFLKFKNDYDLSILLESINITYLKCYEDIKSVIYLQIQLE